jgi:alpha/beta superfamily hydrolase
VIKIKKIYFSENKKDNLLKKAIRASSYLIAILFPRLGLFLGFKVLANPFSMRDYSFKAVRPTSEFDVDGKIGKIKLFYFEGGAKHIILSHGWADTSKSFQSIIQKLNKAGYSVWSLDHIGHGKSEGTLSHALAFIDGLTNAYDFAEEKTKQSGGKIVGFVSHSMGGIAVLNQSEKVLKDKKVVILAVPFHFFDTIFDIIDRIGVSKKIFSNMIKKIEDDFSMVADQINLKYHKDKFSPNFLFIHDEDDEHCPYEDLIPLVSESKAKFITTQGLKHRGSFRDEKVLESILEFFEN